MGTFWPAEVWNSSKTVTDCMWSSEFLLTAVPSFFAFPLLGTAARREQNRRMEQKHHPHSSHPLSCLSLALPLSLALSLSLALPLSLSLALALPLALPVSVSLPCSSFCLARQLATTPQDAKVAVAAARAARVRRHAVLASDESTGVRLYARFVSYVASLEAKQRQQQQQQQRNRGGGSGSGGAPPGGDGDAGGGERERREQRGVLFAMVETAEGVLTPQPVLRLPEEDPAVVTACATALRELAAFVEIARPPTTAGRTTGGR
jgi:hypothetical protein